MSVIAAEMEGQEEQAEGMEEGMDDVAEGEEEEGEDADDGNEKKYVKKEYVAGPYDSEFLQKTYEEVDAL